MGAWKSTSPNSPTPPENAVEWTLRPYATLEEARAALQGRRIVIVEDEGVTQMQLRRTLSHAGLAVVGTAINGRDGVEVVLRERPEIVLMDIRMPIMDGVEAARRILAEYAVCVVMLTAFSDPEYRDQATELGASGYVIKPVTSDMLLPLILQAYHAFQQSQKQSSE